MTANELKDFSNLLNKIEKRASEIAKILRKTHTPKQWVKTYGQASIKDIANSMARKEFS